MARRNRYSELEGVCLAGDEEGRANVPRERVEGGEAAERTRPPEVADINPGKEETQRREARETEQVWTIGRSLQNKEAVLRYRL